MYYEHIVLGTMKRFKFNIVSDNYICTYLNCKPERRSNFIVTLPIYPQHRVSIK